MNFNQQNWEEVLQALGFIEQKNPNGVNCYDVYNDSGIPIWQYDTERNKEKLFYFFSGVLYCKQRIGNM